MIMILQVEYPYLKCLGPIAFQINFRLWYICIYKCRSIYVNTYLADDTHIQLKSCILNIPFTQSMQTILSKILICLRSNVELTACGFTPDLEIFLLQIVELGLLNLYVSEQHFLG